MKISGWTQRAEHDALSHVELRQLRYFVAAAEEGNISRAAKKIFLTQPALSRQIQALETELGQCLFERQAHSIRLTPAGELLLHEARELLVHGDQVLERVRSVGQEVRLRIGYAPSLAAGILSAAVASFSQAHPQARVELLDLSTQEMLAQLENQTLDLALTVGQQRAHRGLTWVPLVRAPWQIALPAHHALARRAKISPAEVAREPLLVFSQRDYPEYWDLVLGWLRQQNQKPKIAGEYDGLESLMLAVQSGLGIAIVTARNANQFPKGVRLKDLSSAPEPLCIAAGLRTSTANDKPLSVFVEELRKAAEAASS